MSILYPEVFLLLFLLFWLFKKGEKKVPLLYLALFFMILALSRPQLHEYMQKEKLKANTFIIALDVSYSMRADDIKPSRLYKAKEIIKSLLTQNPQDRFALFVFTSNPLILAPPTSDHRLILQALASLDVDNILTHSTSLSRLLNHISHLHLKEKNLILLSDGGDENNLEALKKVIKHANINLITIALATQAGAPLKDKFGKNLKDEKNHLIITRLNPLLKPLTVQSAGTFLSYQKEHFSLNFIKQKAYIQQKHISTKELFWIPLLMALLLFLYHYTKLPKRWLLLIPFFSQQGDASLLDWYYIHQAQQAYTQKAYKKASIALESIKHKTLQSQLNLANAYYQAGHYEKAQDIYLSLQTSQPHFKKHILFKLGNCAAMLKRYDTARAYYQEALYFGKDPDIIENLKIIAFKKEQKDDKIVKTTETKKVKEKVQTDTQSGKKSQKSAASASVNSLSHPLGYKAYELINKGYIDEKKPW